MSDHSPPRIQYFIVDGVPVKWVEKADGSLTVLAFRFNTGEFEPDIEYLSACIEPGRDIIEPDEETFNTFVTKLQEARERSES